MITTFSGDFETICSKGSAEYFSYNVLVVLIYHINFLTHSSKTLLKPTKDIQRTTSHYRLLLSG